MSFADLFARYREMGAMGPQPSDEHAFVLNESGNAWNLSANGDSKDAPLGDGDGVKQDRINFKTSRPFQLTPEGEYVRVSSDEEFQEIFSSPHRLGLNLGLLKNNNVCKDYYKLTSNVLRSLMMGIKEIATEEITPAWQVGFPCSSPKRSFSSIFVNKLNDDATYPKLTTLQSAGEIGTPKLSSFNHSANLQPREVVNIANLRRWLWGQMGHPVSYLASYPSPMIETYRADAAVVEHPRSSDSQKSATSEAELSNITRKGLMQVRSSEPEDRTTEEDIPVESANVAPNTSETKVTNADEEIPIDDATPSHTTLASPAEDDEASTKHSTDSESENERLIRRPRQINQTANGNKQFTSSLLSREDEVKKRKYHGVNWKKSVSSKDSSVTIGSGPGEVQRQVTSSRSRQNVVTSNNAAIMPPRPKSWCIVGGYVKRFPTKHNQTSLKIQPPSKSQPQVPLAA